MQVGGALQATRPGGQPPAGGLGGCVLGGGAVGCTEGSGPGARQGQTACYSTHTHYYRPLRGTCLTTPVYHPTLLLSLRPKL